MGKEFTGDGTAYTIAGVVGTARLVQREDSAAVEAYYPLEVGNLPSVVVLVKTSAPPEGLRRALVATGKAISPDVAPYTQLLRISFSDRVKSLEDSAIVVSMLGGVALLIACLGIVGLVAYTVTQRTKEIGIRMALGANPAHVMSTVLRQFRVTVIAGLFAGVLGAAALSQLLQLYGVSHLDPLAYLAAVGLFCVVAAAAAMAPAKRALRIDPMRALRYD